MKLFDQPIRRIRLSSKRCFQIYSRLYGVYFVFWLLGIVWGSNFIYTQIAGSYLKPLQVVFLRLLFGAVPVFIYAVYIKAFKLWHFKYLHHFIFMAITNSVIYYYVVVNGVVLLSSGISGAISGVTPLFSILISFFIFKQERITLLKILGIFLGLIGVLLVVDPFSEGLSSISWLGVFYNLAGSTALAISFVYARQFIVPLQISSSALVSYQLLIGILFVALMVDFQGLTNISHNQTALLLTTVCLGFIGTGVAYIMYYYLVKKIGAVSASSTTYVPPVVALLIGSLIAGEPIGIIAYLGTGLILLGVFCLKKN